MPIIARYFLERACFESGVKYKELTPGAEKLLKQMKFPGNVRELANLMESVAAFVDGEEITASLLRKLHHTNQGTVEADDLNLGRARRRFEKRLINAALDRYETLDKAASALGISAVTLWRKMKLLDD